MRQFDIAREKLKTIIRKRLQILEKEILILKPSLENSYDRFGLALLICKREERAHLISLKNMIRNSLRTKFH